MNKGWRIIGSVVLLAVVAWQLDWSQLGAAFARLDLRLWLLAVGVLVLAQVVSSLRWQLISGPLGFDLGLGRYISLYFTGMFFNLVLPTSVGGDVVRALYLARGNRRRGAAILSVLLDRASGLGMLLALACIAGLFVQDVMPGWMQTILLALAGTTLAGLACLPLLPRLVRWPRLGKRSAQIALAVEVFGNRPGLLAMVTGLSILVQVASVVQMGLIARGLGLDVSWAFMAVTVPLVSLLTLVPISINGMGLREVGLVVLLGPAGVSSASAVTLSLLLFATTVVAGLLGAGFYLGESSPRIEAEPPRGWELEGQSDGEIVGGDSDQGRTGQSASAA